MKEKILTLLLETKEYISGQELCERFGVSRTAVWKVVHQLQEDGYKIEAIRNKGYRLVSVPDRILSQQIRRELHTRWAGVNLICLKEIDSTNNEAKRLAENGTAGHGTLVVSELQTAGKGRRGRGFISPEGCGIFMSLVIKDEIRPERASMLTLVMGLAVQQAIKNLTDLKPQIKWPNDIVVNGKKLCGILTEMSIQEDYISHIVIGTGVNVNNESFPEELKELATSVYMETGKKVSRCEMIAEIMRCFEADYEKYLPTQDLRELINEYNAVLINRGRTVRVLDPREPYSGTALGIRDDGELMVETEDGVRVVSAGEVSVRGVYGYV